MSEYFDLQEMIDGIYFDYACRALLGGGKGVFVLEELKGENPEYYQQVMDAARKHLEEVKSENTSGN